jgi:hypothetical protein
LARFGCVLARRSWGAFEPGHEARVGFDDEDEALLIDYEMLRDTDAFTARYRMCRIRDDNRVVNVDKRVILQRRTCRFGGHRVYFLHTEPPYRPISHTPTDHRCQLGL